MLICCNCQYSWTVKETMHSLFSMKLICPSCIEEQYVSSKSRLKTLFVTCSSIYLQFYFFIFQIDAPIVFIVNILICLLLIMVLPTFYELSKEEESIW